MAVGELRTQYLELTPAEVAALARTRRGGDRARAAPAPLDERAAQIVAGNLKALRQRPGYLAWHDGEVPGRRRSTSRSTSPTRARQRYGRCADHPDFYEHGVDPGTDRITYAGRLHAATPNPATAPGTARTSPRSRQATICDGAVEQDAPASATGWAWRRVAQVGASKIFRCTGAARHLEARANGVGRVRRRRAHLQQLVGLGHRPRVGLLHDCAGSTTSSCATPSRASPATSRWSRCSPPGNDGDAILGSSNEGYGTIARGGNRQERDHRRRLGGRARERHRRLRNDRRRADSAARHRQLLEPRPDR